MKWTGAVSVRWFGRTRSAVAWPFATLILEEGRVRMKVRSVGKLVDRAPLDCSVRELMLAYYDPRLPTSRIGFRTAGRPDVFFVTVEAMEILFALREQGFRVEIQRARVGRYG